MKSKPGRPETPSERLVRDTRRVTRKQYSAEEKIRIVLDGLRIWFNDCAMRKLFSPYPAMKASADLKKSSRPSAGNSSSISNSRCFLALGLSSSVSRRPIWFRMSRTSVFGAADV